ncbi:MAG TPA: hypothetical protein VLA48_02465 [Nitrososphaeraceae archaeon]|nr:hypothetical protein [Nitrososphaeraceae archaeon]
MYSRVVLFEAFLRLCKMSKKITTELFVQKAEIVHGYKYDYSKSVYTESRNFIIITCPIHGDFSQRANCHTTGKGCKKCGVDERIRKRTFTNQLFIEKVNLLFNNKYDYSLINYKNSNSLIDIICPQHGVFCKKASKHIQGQGCPICSSLNHSGRFKNSTTDTFIMKATEIHGDEFDYSSVLYKSAIETVKIICKQHGVFEQTPHTHLTGSGCNKCGIESTANKRRNTLEYFIEKANEKHKNTYSYLNSIYKNSDTKIIITCNKHGDFRQIPSSHLNGNGCPSCAREITTKNSQDNPVGWSHSNWIKAGEKSKNFDSFKVYIIRCWNDDEEFYKIGRTFKKIKDRFDDKNTMPYRYETVLEIISDALTVLKLEKELQVTYKNLKYMPDIYFNGKHECFNLSLPIQEIIDYLEK